MHLIATTYITLQNSGLVTNPIKNIFFTWITYELPINTNTHNNSSKFNDPH